MARQGKGGIPPHKHETPQDRADRHAQVAKNVRARFSPASVDYTAWLAMHREAENATIFNPNHRDGRRKHHTNPDGWAAGGGI